MPTYEETRAIEIKQTRREILSVLELVYQGSPFGFEAICFSIAHLELADEAYVEKDLQYLCDKGYVRWTNKGKMIPWSKRFFKLTAAGKELVDRIATDPALEI